MSGASDARSVTTIVTRKIIPGRKADYREWVHQVGAVAERFPGHQGTTYKLKGDGDECHVVFRFDTIEHLRAWEESAERKHWQGKLGGIVQGEERIKRLTGLEFLFRDQYHPKAHKMALVLTATIFCLVLIFNPAFAFLTGAFPVIPDLLWILVRTALQVVLMTYVIMPPLSRLLAPWLNR